MASKTFPSKTKNVTCGYCNLTLLKVSLTAHNNLKHPGLPEFIAPEAGGTKITGYFGTKTKKRKISESENEDVELDVSNRDVERESDLSEEVRSKSIPEPSVTDARLDELLERVKDIQISISSSKLVRPALPPLAKPKDVATSDERIKQLQICRAIKEILDHFPEFEYKKKDGYVICTLCVPESTVTSSTNNRGTDNGMFMYDSNSGLEFADDVNLPRTFINLKKNLKDHLHKKTHIANWTSWKEKEAKETADNNRNKEIGLRIARICYVLYKEGRSERSFETEVARKIQDGLDMDDINHSHKWPA